MTFFFSFLFFCEHQNNFSFPPTRRITAAVVTVTVSVDEFFRVCLWLVCSSCVSSCQGLCLEIEQTQQASDSAELERWSKLSSSARDELATLKCILGSMKDSQVAAARKFYAALFSLLNFVFWFFPNKVQNKKKQLYIKSIYILSAMAKKIGNKNSQQHTL